VEKAHCGSATVSAQVDAPAFVYDSTSVSMHAGQAFYVEHGPRSRHQTHITKNERALVLLFENTGHEASMI
jgi:hypothetical protein